MLWMSAKIPNDQFLLYAFDGSPVKSTPRSTRCGCGQALSTSCECVSSTTARSLSAGFRGWWTDRNSSCTAAAEPGSHLTRGRAGGHNPTRTGCPGGRRVPRSDRCSRIRWLGTVVVVQMAHALGTERGQRRSRACCSGGELCRCQARVSPARESGGAGCRGIGRASAAERGPGRRTASPARTAASTARAHQSTRCGEGRFRTVVVRRSAGRPHRDGCRHGRDCRSHRRLLHRTRRFGDRSRRRGSVGEPQIAG